VRLLGGRGHWSYGLGGGLGDWRLRARNDSCWWWPAPAEEEGALARPRDGGRPGLSLAMRPGLREVRDNLRQVFDRPWALMAGAANVW